MSNGNETWMPLYIGDYLGDTMELDGAQHGAYLLLLMYYWRNGPLPIDDAKLAQIARTDIRVWKKTVGPVVRAFFTQVDGRLHQKRADLEIAKAAECHQRAKALREGDADRLRRWRQQRQMPTREWDELRAEIFARDGSKCRRCGSGDDLHCDHILELSDGGTNDPDNLITLCRTCHSRKTAEAKTERPKPNGEMPVKRISRAFPEHIETRSEMPPKPVVQSQPTTQVQPEKEERKVTKLTFSSPVLARAATPQEAPADALETLMDEAEIEKPQRLNRQDDEPPSSDPVVLGHINRTAKALRMSLPYGVVRSGEVQLDAIQPHPQVVGADASMGLRWQPAEPANSIEAQIAAARAGCSGEQIAKAAAYAARFNVGTPP